MYPNLLITIHRGGSSASQRDGRGEDGRGEDGRGEDGRGEDGWREDGRGGERVVQATRWSRAQRDAFWETATSYWERSGYGQSAERVDMCQRVDAYMAGEASDSMYRTLTDLSRAVGYMLHHWVEWYVGALDRDVSGESALALRCVDRAAGLALLEEAHARMRSALAVKYRSRGI